MTVPPLLKEAGRLLALAAMFACAGCGSATAPDPALEPVPAPPSAASAPAAPVPENEISDLAQREIIRRQDRLLRSDAAALESHRRMAEGDLEGAVSGYRSAVSELDRP